MYWEQKIDLIKKAFSESDFKDPYFKGSEVIEKILFKLHNCTWAKFYNAENRTVLIKNGKLFKTCTITQLYLEELPRLLDKQINIWLLFINVPQGKGFQIYDCKYSAMMEALHYSSGLRQQEFYIVEKKYNWLLYFKIDRDNDVVEIFTNNRQVDNLRLS